MAIYCRLKAGGDPKLSCSSPGGCRCYALTFVIVIAAFLCSSEAPVSAAPWAPKVLILNAYHQGEDWSDLQIEGILTAFQKTYPFMVPSVEHLDTKRFPGDEHLAFIKAYLLSKYRGRTFDLVMTLDNSALDVMMRYRAELFSDVPIVFAGVNGYRPEMLEGYDGITGVAEVQDMAGTLELALAIHPEATTVLAVHDYTSSGMAVHRDMEAVADRFRSRVRITYTPSGSVEDLQDQLASLPEDALVLLLTYVTDSQGRTLTREESTRLITKASAVPVYAMHATRLGYGIMGGNLLEGREHGLQAAQIALRVLSGEAASQIPVESSRSVPTLDHDVLTRFEVPESRVPDQVSFVNRPISFWEEYRTVALPSLIVVAFFLLSTMLLCLLVLRMRRTEQTLRESEEKFRQLAETIDEVFWIGSPEWDAVYYISPAYEKVWGRTCESLIAHPMSWFDAIVEEDREDIASYLAERRNGSLDEIVFPDCRIKRQDGEVRWISARAFPLMGDPGGIDRIVGVCSDITRRKRVEEDLRRTGTRLLQAHQMAQLGHWDWDMGTGTLTWSDETYGIFGRRKEDFTVTAESFEQCIHPDDLAAFVREREQALKEQRAVNIEHRIILPDGTIRHVQELAEIVRDDRGEPIRVSGSVQDITDRMELESRLQQTQKMEAIGTLAGGIAHDFNNILGIIMGSTELSLQEVPLGSSVHRNLGEALKASNRAKELVKQILTFSRKSKQIEQPLALELIVKEALRMLRATLPTTIEIQQNLQKNVGFIMADPTQMHQVVMNLTTNASHAMGESGGVLRVELSGIDVTESDARENPDLHAGPYVKLTVSDTGDGIAPTIMDRIFEPYFTTKGIGHGTGLGLSVVHGIVINHDGAIDVSSEVGKGTRFDLYFPAIQQTGGAEALAKVEDHPTGTDRILFVDDEASMTNIYRSMLERLGYTVDVCTNGVEALEVFRAEPDRYDLIITDQTMPRMTGQMLAAEAMAIRPGIPVILCTGHSDSINEAKAKEKGISAFLMKPLSMGVIARSIREVLAGGL